VLPAFATVSVRVRPPLAARAADRDGRGRRTGEDVDISPRAPRDRVTLSDDARRARRAASPPAQHRAVAAEATRLEPAAIARARTAAATYARAGGAGDVARAPA